MAGLDYLAWFILIVMTAAFIVGFIVVAQLPGKMAAANKHPHTAAITFAGWLGLIFTAGIVWIVAMIWANMKPTDRTTRVEDFDGLKVRVTNLEEQLKTLAEK